MATGEFVVSSDNAASRSTHDESQDVASESSGDHGNHAVDENSEDPITAVKKRQRAIHDALKANHKRKADSDAEAREIRRKKFEHNESNAIDTRCPCQAICNEEWLAGVL